MLETFLQAAEGGDEETLLALVRAELAFGGGAPYDTTDEFSKSLVQLDALLAVCTGATATRKVRETALDGIDDRLKEKLAGSLLEKGGNLEEEEQENLLSFLNYSKSREIAESWLTKVERGEDFVPALRGWVTMEVLLIASATTRPKLAGMLLLTDGGDGAVRHLCQRIEYNGSETFVRDAARRRKEDIAQSTEVAWLAALTSEPSWKYENGGEHIPVGLLWLPEMKTSAVVKKVIQELGDSQAKWQLLSKMMKEHPLTPMEQALAAIEGMSMPRQIGASDNPSAETKEKKGGGIAL